MSRLIDADGLLEIMEERKKPEFGADGSKDRYRYMQWLADYQAIKSAPTIDAVEVVRGEWKPFDRTWGRSIWYCTACKESVDVPCDIWTNKPIYNYCPNCGARMKRSE